MNVAEQAENFLLHLEEDWQWNGVDIADIDRETCWHQEYAIFVISFDQWPYFDNFEFSRDFIEYMKSWFPGCEIKHYERCDEYEITGPNYKDFYAAHMDKIEQYMEDHGDESHVVFPEVKI